MATKPVRRYLVLAFEDADPVLPLHRDYDPLVGIGTRQLACALCGEHALDAGLGVVAPSFPGGDMRGRLFR